MTIFDVLRYPITNIYDVQYLDTLPKAVIHNWAKRCVQYSESIEDIGVSTPELYAVLRSRDKTIYRLVKQPGHVIVGVLVDIRFAQFLKEELSKYEG